jgi:hypothetical protein
MARKVTFKQHKPVGFGDGYVKGSVVDHQNKARRAADGFFSICLPETIHAQCLSGSKGWRNPDGVLNVNDPFRDGWGSRGESMLPFIGQP